MNKKTLIIVCIVFLAVLIGAAVLYGALADKMAPDALATQGTQENGASSPTEDKRMLAPDFTAYDLDGNEMKLSDFIGKPIVLNFWASWCGPCKMEMPEFNEFYQKYGENVQFLMVNMTDGSRETVEKASSFIEKNGYTFPVYYDTAFSAAMTYGVTSLPTTYFIDTDGYLVAQGRGALSRDNLQTGIDMIYSD